MLRYASLRISARFFKLRKPWLKPFFFTYPIYISSIGMLLPFVLQPPASIFALSIRNIHRPGFPTLEFELTLIILSVADPGTLKYLIPSPALKPACLTDRKEQGSVKRIGETTIFHPMKPSPKLKKKEESNLKRVYIGPTRSCFKLHVTAVALHRLWSTDSRYLCWRTSKPAYIPSTGSTCCPCDIVVIINYKWVFTIGYENRLKSVCLVKRNRNYNKDIVIGNTGLLTLLLYFG